MSPEVLRWVQGDPALQPGTPEWCALGVAFTGGSPRTKTELNAKFILAGHLGERPRSSQLRGLSLAAALPVPRLQAWFRAFLAVNTDGLGQQPILQKRSCVVFWWVSDISRFAGLSAPFCVPNDFDVEGPWPDGREQVRLMVGRLRSRMRAVA